MKDCLEGFKSLFYCFGENSRHILTSLLLFYLKMSHMFYADLIVLVRGSKEAQLL